MDCEICNHNAETPTMGHRLKICAGCYWGAISLHRLIKMKTTNHKNDKEFVDELNSSLNYPPSFSSGSLQVLKWGYEKIKMEAELNEKINFLSGSITAFRDHSHTDIRISPGNHGPTPAHRAILATKSEIFKNMLEYDTCKAAPKDTITVPDLNHEELESLLEFLYTGTLPPEKVEKHVYSLLIAADKYEIAYLPKFCEQRMIQSLNTSNALDVLEISDVCSNQTLKQTTLDFIAENIISDVCSNHPFYLDFVAENMHVVVFSPRFDDFALKNPHLIVEITRALYMKNKTNRERERRRRRESVVMF